MGLMKKKPGLGDWTDGHHGKRKNWSCRGHQNYYLSLGSFSMLIVERDPYPALCEQRTYRGVGFTRL
jgi:hypothetical protein